MQPDVLVVDDHEEFLQVAEEILTSWGYTVRVVASTLEALAVYHAEHPRLILTDLLMPDLDGIELLRILRAEGATVPIIAVSSGGSMGRPQGLLDEAATLGASATFRKPLDFQEVVRAMETLGVSPQKPPRHASHGRAA
jgi:CheY-like chemotaxis protein